MDTINNRLTVSQKSKTCGEIRLTFTVGAAEDIDVEIRERAERELRAIPDHQLSYYDMVLVTANGRELDFETNIL